MRQGLVSDGGKGKRRIKKVIGWHVSSSIHPQYNTATTLKGTMNHEETSYFLPVEYKLFFPTESIMNVDITSFIQEKKIGRKQVRQNHLQMRLQQPRNRRLTQQHWPSQQNHLPQSQA